MVPTLLVNDRIVVNRFIYRFRPPERGEVIVFHAPPQASPVPKDFVKRAIGLPNETIEIVPDRLVVDGRPVARLVSATEASDTQRDLVIPAGAKLDVVENQLLVDGRPFVVLSTTGGASPRPDGLYVDGRPVQAFTPGDLVQPQSLPPPLRRAGLHGSLFGDGAGNALYVIRGRRLGLDPGHVEVNGTSLGREPYVRETPRYSKGPIKLGANQYFMMGDNRNNSADSHAWGPLDGQRIVGKATLMFWPPTRAGLVRGNELYAHTGK
jgi:signal peptidase I